MKKYDLHILTEQEVIKLLDNKIESLEFNENGFICNTFDVVGELQKKLHKPIVSIFKVNRPGWNAIYITTAKGYVNENGECYLYYNSEDEYKEVFRDIFTESENDEYEIYDNYTLFCDSDMKKRLDAWLHEEY